jgi:hypothetical protein
MRTDLMVELAGVLAGLGAALQFLRARAWIKDQFTITLGVVCAVGLWALAVDWSKAASDPQAFILHNLAIVGGFVSSLLLGIFGTAGAAAFAVSKGADPANPLVPHTDSKP